MYLILNGQQYSDITLYSSGGNDIRFVGESLTGITEITEPVTVYGEDGYVFKTYNSKDYNKQIIADGAWRMTTVFMETPITYDLAHSTANAVRILMSGKQPTTADEIIMCSALYDEWEPGSHVTGDVFTVSGDPWECFQSYDNAVYPDIAPGNSAWYTFNRPYHGTSRETARNFVHPTGAHDIYKTGEWAIQDGKVTKCLSDTSYSMEEYPAAGEVEE